MRPIRLIACITLTVVVVCSLNAICHAPAVSAAPGAPAPQSHSRGLQSPSEEQEPATSPMPVLRTGANLVLVDVMVTEKDKAVHGLDKSHFHIFDNGHEQTIANFDEHRPPPELGAAPVTEELPPNTYTNAPVYPQTGTLNVLLLDSLNTPTFVANMDVRRQMLEYMSHIPPGTPLAIFTLGSRLQLVQGFTTDTSLLNKALAIPKAGPEKSPINDLDADKVEDERIANFVANNPAPGIGGVQTLMRWMAEDTATQTGQRVTLTLDAMEQLARYLSAIPGRKNVIWFSGSFPMALTPADNDPYCNIFNPAAATRGYSDEMRQTDVLLGSARVAIYPVDARGLLNLPSVDAAYTPNTNLAPQGGGCASSPESSQGGGTGGLKGNTSPAALVNKPNIAIDNMKAMGETLNEHASMYQIAAETGGHAYLNTNDLKGAVADILENGSSYYTIGFVPDAKKLDGKLHAINVKVDDAHDQLSYREGYYADQPGKGSDHNLGEANPITAAMELGAPAATQIVFQTRVLPASDPLLQNVKLPEGPTGDKTSKLKGPVKRFVVDIAVDPHDLAFTPMSDGTYRDEIFYYIFAYDANGKPVNELRQGFQLNISAKQYAWMMAANGAGHIDPHRMAIDLPAGEMTLRIVVYEPPSAHIGSFQPPSAHVGSFQVPVTVAAR